MEERMHSVHSACALGVSAALVLTLCAAPQAAFASESADSLDASLGALSASADESQAPFSDVSDGEWYAQIVDRAYTLGLLTGYEGTDLFGPSDGMTRGQMVVVLKRLFDNADFSGAPYWGSHADELRLDFPSGNETGFTDVSDGEYCTAAINWAMHYHIVSGYDGTDKFGPNDPLTREQCAKMIASWLGFYGYDPSASYPDWDRSDEVFLAYSDAGDISLWARNAVLAARQNGCMTGVPSDGGLPQFYPKRSLERCEAAKIAVVLHETMHGQI